MCSSQDKEFFWMKDPESGPSIEVTEERADSIIGEDPSRKELESSSPLVPYSAVQDTEAF